MTKPFILSAAIGELALSDPAWAGPILEQAQKARLDLLLLGRPGQLPFDPQVIAAWAAPRVSTMGVVPVVTARLAHPFHVARALSAVDWLSGGMLGWCPVGEGHPAEQIADLAMATRALWDGWSDDTLIIDKAAGRYLDA
ncbi:MAG TPA: nitrilotriacetate monooxygenase, partial [Novosphingobium sp.]|nr:nitrilotriacetate monooxygenase [Novosphingobium sp.]